MTFWTYWDINELSQFTTFNIIKVKLKSTKLVSRDQHLYRLFRWMCKCSISLSPIDLPWIEYYIMLARTSLGLRGMTFVLRRGYQFPENTSETHHKPGLTAKRIIKCVNDRLRMIDPGRWNVHCFVNVGSAHHIQYSLARWGRDGWYRDLHSCTRGHWEGVWHRGQGSMHLDLWYWDCLPCRQRKPWLTLIADLII